MKAKVIKTGEIVDVYHEPQHGQVNNIYKECVLVNGRMWSEDELDFYVKANEAPEKIYLDINMSTDTIGDLWHEWFDAKVSDDSIEYIRMDSFIEKVCEWLEENIAETTGIDSYAITESFKQAMGK